MKKNEAISILATSVRPREQKDIARYDEAVKMAIDALNESERKTGKWIPVDSYSAFGGDEVMWEAHGNPIAFYYCSECKEHAYAGEDGESLLTTYCPHCGSYNGGD